MKNGSFPIRLQSEKKFSICIHVEGRLP